MRVMNAELRQQNLDYEVSTEHLSKRVASLQDFVKKLSVMAGLDTAVAGETLGGVGGPNDEDIDTSESAYAQVKENLEFMAGELSTLEDKGRVLERFYEQNSLMLASTPSIWPVRGYLSSTFGRRKDPFTGAPVFHSGIDISTPVGRPVVATADGIVLYASRRGSYGNTIVIDHKYSRSGRPFGDPEGLLDRAKKLLLCEVLHIVENNRLLPYKRLQLPGVLGRRDDHRQVMLDAAKPADQFQTVSIL